MICDFVICDFVICDFVICDFVILCFVIRTYGKSEFALLMFPTIDDPKVAQAKLLRWIKKDRQFHQSLVGMGLSSHDKDYSPEQVRAMVEKFGAPGEYEI